MNHRLKKFVSSFLAFALIIIGSQAHGFFAANKVVYRPNILQLGVTKKGRDFFRNNLYAFLKAKGIPLETNDLDDMVYDPGQEIDLENLPPHMKKFEGQLKSVRTSIKKVLSGFTLENPIPYIKLNSPKYSARIEHLGTRLLGETGSNGPAKGIVLSLDISISHLEITSDSLIFFDKNNEFLFFDEKGKFLGIETAGLRLFNENPKKLITLQIPLVIGVKENGGLYIYFEKATTNLADANLALDFERPFRKMPKYPGTFNGRPFTIDLAPYEEEIVQMAPNLMPALQGFLNQHLQETLPAILNEQVENKLPYATLEDINTLTPPFKMGDKEPIPISERYLWGIRAQDIGQKGEDLYFKFRGFIEDPQKPLKTFANTPALLEPNVSDFPKDDYDVYLALNQEALNKILAQDFARGLIPNIDITPEETKEERQKRRLREIRNKLPVDSTIEKQYVRHLKAPQVILQKSISRDLIPIEVTLGYKPKGFWEDLAINKELTITVTGQLRAFRTRKGGLSLKLLYLDDHNFRASEGANWPLKGKINNYVKNALQRQNAELKKIEPGKLFPGKTIIDELPLPSEISGVDLEIRAVKADQNGYLILYVGIKGLKK